jgi:hypothetical protein
MQQSELVELFVKYCPIWYYTDKEPYMPATFEDILNISTLTARPPRTPTVASMETYEALKTKLEADPLAERLDPEGLNKILSVYPSIDIDGMLIKVNRELRKKIPVSKQIICRSTGMWSRSAPTADIHWKFLDLQYITLYSWNGTLSEHAFDAESVVVRLVKSDEDSEWKIKRVYGSSHGNGMWTDYRFLEMEGNHPVIYCAEESHSMYFKPAVYKRMFRFADDVCRRDIRWTPTEFIHVPMDTLPATRVEISENSIIKKLSGLNRDGTELQYYLYHGFIGDEKNNQIFPLSSKYQDTDTNNLDGYYKYEGGVNNIFNGRHAVVPHAAYIAILVAVACILSVNAVLSFLWPVSRSTNTKVSAWLIALKLVLNILSIPAFMIATIAFMFVN